MAAEVAKPRVDHLAAALRPGVGTRSGGLRLPTRPFHHDEHSLPLEQGTHQPLVTLRHRFRREMGVAADRRLGETPHPPEEGVVRPLPAVRHAQPGITEPFAAHLAEDPLHAQRRRFVGEGIGRDIDVDEIRLEVIHGPDDVVHHPLIGPDVADSDFHRLAELGREHVTELRMALRLFGHEGARVVAVSEDQDFHAGERRPASCFAHG